MCVLSSALTVTLWRGGVPAVAARIKIVKITQTTEKTNTPFSHATYLLVQAARRPEELLFAGCGSSGAPALQINAEYYIVKSILPALDRVFKPIGVKVSTLHSIYIYIDIKFDCIRYVDSAPNQCRVLHR